MGYNEVTTEISTRRRRQDLEGIEKGARTELKNWRETMGNTKRKGEPKSGLCNEYGEAISNYRERSLRRIAHGSILLAAGVSIDIAYISCLSQ